METDKQFEFVWKQLEAAAASIGINLEKSIKALVALAFHSDNCGEELRELCEDEATYLEALRLTKTFPTKAGKNMLVELGNACMFSDRHTFMGRSWEPSDDLDKWNSGSKESSLENRVLCDFAMWTGIASNLCARYSCKDKPSLAGAAARANKYKELEDEIIKLWRTEFDPALSASAAAEEMIGRIKGAKFRKIVEVISRAKKVQDATQNAQDATHHVQGSA